MKGLKPPQNCLFWILMWNVCVGAQSLPLCNDLFRRMPIPEEQPAPCAAGSVPSSLCPPRPAPGQRWRWACTSSWCRSQWCWPDPEKVCKHPRKLSPGYQESSVPAYLFFSPPDINFNKVQRMQFIKVKQKCVFTFACASACININSHFLENIFCNLARFSAS